MYNYFSVHDLKDTAMIYNDRDDYRVVVWDPELQREGELYFTGSSNIKKTVNFNIKYEGTDGSVFTAFKDTIREEFNITDEKELEELMEKFMRKMLEIRK